MDKSDLMPEMFANPTGEWESVTPDGTARLKVDSGYVYRIETSKGLTMCYVPDIDLQRYQAHLRDAYNKGFADGLEEGKAHKELLAE
jgi:hypothetical protein